MYRWLIKRRWALFLLYEDSRELARGQTGRRRIFTGDRLLVGSGLLILLFGLVSLSFAQDSFSESYYNDDLIRNAVGNLFRLVEGAFGALIMVFCGIIALISAAARNFKLCTAVLIVALMCFILRSFVSLFFGENFENF